MKRKPSLIPAIIFLIISTFLLLMPGTAFPKEDFLSKIYFDKWVHIGMFAILVTLWCYGWRSVKQIGDKVTYRKSFIIIGIAFLAYGIVMEFVQGNLIPHRSFDFGDIVADAAGSLVGVVFSTRRYIKK